MRTPIRTTAIAGAIAALVLAGCSSGGSGDASARGGKASTTTSTAAEPVIDPGDGGDYHPSIDPAGFVSHIDNPWYPLLPGATWSYEGTSDGETETTQVRVLEETREVMGIAATVVRDTVRVNGEVVEDAYDWFAQDADGNVWYLGEDVRDYENGEVVSTAGSWEAGVDGALPGIVMPADPQEGDAFRQEYFPGEAEDLFEITHVGGTVELSGSTFVDVVVTKEWNPLEPEIIEQKTYGKGVGLVSEETLEGATEVATLVYHHPGSIS